MRARSATGLLLLAVAAAGCGAAPAAPATRPVAAVAGATSFAPATPGPVQHIVKPITIDWDNPLQNAVDVPAPTSGSLAQAAQTTGQLGFIPSVPALGTATKAVTTDPTKTSAAARTMAFIFHLPASFGLTGDNRVVVQETPTTQNSSVFDDILAESQDPSEFAVLKYRGDKALLVTGQGTSRLMFIHNGLMIDIAGPAIPPVVVQQLGQLVP